MTPEFSRAERFDAIGHEPREIAIEASDDERAALAKRFDLVAIDALAARFTVSREAGAVLATGRVTASVVQACAITDEPLPARIDEAVTLRFVMSLTEAEDVELGEDVLDTIEVGDDTIDLGEAAAETLALALDPFPRGPDAAAALKAAGVIGEDEVEPVTAFAGLKALLDKR